MMRGDTRVGHNQAGRPLLGSLGGGGGFQSIIVSCAYRALVKGDTAVPYAFGIPFVGNGCSERTCRLRGMPPGDGGKQPRST